MRMTGALILFAAACVPPCAVADDSLGRVFGAIGWTAAAGAAAGYLWGPERSRLAAGDDLRAEDQDGAEDEAAAKGAYASPAASPRPASEPAPADQVEDKDLKACLSFCQRNALFVDVDSRLSYENCFDFCDGELEFAMGDRVQFVVTPGEVESVGTVLGVVQYKGILRFGVMLDWEEGPLPFESHYLEKLENPAPKHECEPKPGAEPEAFKVKLELSFHRGDVWKCVAVILVSMCMGAVLLGLALPSKP